MRIACPGCAKPLNLPDSLAGKAVQCSACGSQFRLPAARGAVPPPLPKKTTSPLTRTRQKGAPAVRSADEPIRRARSASPPALPRSRRAQVRHIDEDENSGRTVRRRRYRDDDDFEEDDYDEDDYEEEAPKKRNRPKKRRRRVRTPFSWAKFNLILLAVNFGLFFMGLVLCLPLGSFGFFFPSLIQLLIFVVASIASSIIFLVIAFMDDVIEGLLVLFVPFYAIYYLCKNPETHGSFCMSLVAMLYLLTIILEGAIAHFSDHTIRNPPPQFRRVQFEQPRYQQPQLQPAPVQQIPVAQKVKGDPRLDGLLAQLQSTDRRRVADSGGERMPMVPEHQPEVFAKLLATCKIPLDANENGSRSFALGAIRKWTT
jgi:hypothetical protein